MDLLERYLQAIGRYLPEDSREDTLAELRENLLAQMEAREEELARPLDDSELAAVLKAHGKPETVAVQYLPQRSLIGPALFPFYWFTLRRVLPLVVLVYAIARAASFASAYGRGIVAKDIAGAVFQLVPTLLTAWAAVTLVFAVIEIVRRMHGEEEHTEDWNPAKLPRLTQPEGTRKLKSRASRVADLAVHCLWMAYVFEIPRHPFLILGPGVFALQSSSLALAPVWYTFFDVLMVLLSVQLAMKILALFPPRPKLQVSLDWVVKLLGLGLLVVLVCSGRYFMPASAAVDHEKLIMINAGVGLSLRIVLVIRVLTLLWDGAKTARRFWPMKRIVL